MKGVRADGSHLRLFTSCIHISKSAGLSETVVQGKADPPPSETIVQDFEFNVASSRVRISADGDHVLATGIYAPDRG